LSISFFIFFSTYACDLRAHPPTPPRELVLADKGSKDNLTSYGLSHCNNATGYHWSQI